MHLTEARLGQQLCGQRGAAVHLGVPGRVGPDGLDTDQVLQVGTHRRQDVPHTFDKISHAIERSAPAVCPAYRHRMPSMGHLLAFGLISLLVIVIPGPSVLFTVGRALTVGRRQALLTVAGNAMGAYVQILAVALGAGALILASSLAFSVIKFVGAAYLIYLGVQAIRHRHGLGEVLTGGASAKRPSRVLADGFVVGMTNPKTIVFFVAALPQVVDPAAGRVTAQMLVLGVVFLSIAVISDSIWALAAGLARDWFAQSPRRFAAIGGAGGLAMVGLGVSLAVTGRKD